MPRSRAYTVPPNSRFTVYLNGELGNIGGVAATFRRPLRHIRSTVERAVYWGAGRVEGTTSVGVAGAAPTNGTCRKARPAARSTRSCWFRTRTGETVSLDISLYVEGVGQFTAPAAMRPVLAPYSRKTVYMHDYLVQLGNAEGYNLAGRSFSTRVRVVNNVAPIAVEHALYWQRDGTNFWRGGSGSFGIRR